MRLYFRCRTCGLTNVPVEVPAREPSQKLSDWVDMIVANNVSAAHDLRSPVCSDIEFDLLLPPADDADYVGQNGMEEPPDKDVWDKIDATMGG